jgi:hypothetical protein
MIPVIIFALSIGLQLAAALFALLLIRTSRRKIVRRKNILKVTPIFEEIFDTHQD